MSTALVISAHSADFVWRCGGAIALHAEKGIDVTVVCLSYGERGESAKLWKNAGMTLEGVKAARRKEAESCRHGARRRRHPVLRSRRLSARARPRREVPARRRHPQGPAGLHAHRTRSEDPYNTDHPTRRASRSNAAMIAQAWGHNPGEKVLGAPQLYLFEPHQTEQMRLEARHDPRHHAGLGEEEGRHRVHGRPAAPLGLLHQRRRKPRATSSGAIPAARPAGARRNMPKASSRSSRAPWTRCDDERRPQWHPRHVDARRHVEGRLFSCERSARRPGRARRASPARHGLARSAPDRWPRRSRPAHLQGRDRLEIRSAGCRRRLSFPAGVRRQGHRHRRAELRQHPRRHRPLRHRARPRSGQ